MKKAVLTTLLIGLGSLFGADHTVELLNKGKDGAQVFEPGFVYAQPGDTITFVATDPTHNVKSVVIPAGAQDFKSPGATMKKGEKYTITLSKEGVYVYECTPHTPMGMVGIIQVGKATNADKINEGIFKQKKAQERLSLYAKEIKK